MDFIKILAAEFNLRANHVQNIVEMIDEGNTIPFIARYRKEMTGSIDDQLLRVVVERLQYLRNLEKRRQEIVASLTELEKLTPALADELQQADSMARLEDIYRPYKPKRRTRATIAREKGLEPLAMLLIAQQQQQGNPLDFAAPFVNAELEVATAEDALAGACDILAEDISDDADIRQSLREWLRAKAELTVKAVAENADSVYAMYADYSEAIAKIPAHRVLAINRGEKENFLKVALVADEDHALDLLEQRFIPRVSIFEDLLCDTVADAYKRLLFPSLARELRTELTEMAGEQAIRIFGLNLQALLLQPPIKGKVALGFDPAYRTGCKLAVVDQTGKVLDTTVIYPTPPQSKVDEARYVLRDLIEYYGVDIIAIGNGTAGRESEIFVANLLQEIPRKVAYMVVNEAGASVYSASKLAAEEFPQYDVSIRSAISIARRLQDPLAELVKIDPKSVGVGQYQHDMAEKQLDSTLTGVVEDCVNKVGVDLNTASAALLSYIAGLSPAVAKNIVDYRDANGPFTKRSQLAKIPRLGPKAYEQCAGFLRIPSADSVLDNTAVHPESYAAAKKLLALFGFSQADVGSEKLLGLPALVKARGEQSVADACGIGVPTLQDMIGELLRPGRDLRDELPPPLLREGIMELKDLTAGMLLDGTVRNVTDFGAFVDIGVHQDGLVHISQISDRFIKHPSELLKVGDIVKVRVLDVDVAKKRISLTMRK